MNEGLVDQFLNSDFYRMKLLYDKNIVQILPYDKNIVKILLYDKNIVKILPNL